MSTRFTNPVTQQAFLDLRRLAKNAGIYIYLVSAHRTPAEQMELIRRYNNRQGGVVYPPASPETSKHVKGLAFDIKATLISNEQSNSAEVYAMVGAIAKTQLKLAWGGDYGDYVHFEITQAYLNDYNARYRTNYTIDQLIAMAEPYNNPNTEVIYGGGSWLLGAVLFGFLVTYFFD